MNAIEELEMALIVQISRDEAAHVLWRLTGGQQGYEPGSFTDSLIEAIFLADPQNQRRLGLGFPGYVAAVQLYQLVRGGQRHLERLAARQ